MSSLNILYRETALRESGVTMGCISPPSAQFQLAHNQIYLMTTTSLGLLPLVFYMILAIPLCHIVHPCISTSLTRLSSYSLVSYFSSLILFS
jgi:hypothetical protein